MDLNPLARKRAEALAGECRLHRAYAIALSRSGGHCEYCGADLLWDRLGYGVGRVDHLLPKGHYLKEVTEAPDNWVLACDVCNSIKGTACYANPTSGRVPCCRKDSPIGFAGRIVRSKMRDAFRVLEANRRLNRLGGLGT